MYTLKTFQAVKCKKEKPEKEIIVSHEAVSINQHGPLTEFLKRLDNLLPELEPSGSFLRN